MTHIAVGICHREDRMVSTDWAYGHKSMGMPLGTSFAYIPVYGDNVAEGRNKIVEKAIELNADYLFFNDDDVIVNPETMHLLVRSQHNLRYLYGESCKDDMVTGVYWGKGFPPEPLIFRSSTPGEWSFDGPYYDWVIGDFIEVDAAGCGAVLIPMSVFKKLEKPWFRLDYDSDFNRKLYGLNTTEDLLFYHRARAAGVRLWCDTWVQLGHWDRNRRLTFTAPPDAIQLRERFEVVGGEGTLVVIGSGRELRAFPEFKNVIKVDAHERNEPDLVNMYHNISLKNQIADVVYARNILPIYPIDEVKSILIEWLRLLKIGGTLHLTVPDLEVAARNILDKNWLLWPMWGNVDGSTFRSGFTKDSLLSILKEMHMEIEKVWSEDDESLFSVRATKIEEY